MKYDNLHKAVMDVLQEKKIKHPNQQVLDVHEPEKDELTAKDFEMLRAGKKAKAVKEENVEEASHQAATTMKHIKNPTAGEKAAAKDIKPGVAGYRDRVAMLKSAEARGGLKREEVEQEDLVDETLEFHDSFTIEIKENYNFGDYLTAAKRLVGEEEAINLANKAFKDQDTSIFVEQYSASAVEDKVKAHMAAGHKVTMPKYSTRDGKPRAEYVVTDKETGVRRRYIHQGNVTKMENMGARGKKD